MQYWPEPLAGLQLSTLSSPHLWIRDNAVGALVMLLHGRALRLASLAAPILAPRQLLREGT